jgi:hypothetical protein
MGDPNSISDEMDSIFDDLDSDLSPASAAPAGAPAARADTIPLPEVSAEDVPEPAFDVSAQVQEFAPLNRRRMRGQPALDLAESERWLELREQLEYAFGSASPPLAGSQRRTVRVPARVKVHLAGSAESLATLRNLSEHGAFIELEQPLTPDSTLSLEIEAGSGGPVVNVEACVKWSREIANMDGPAGMGVEFTAIEDSDADVLAAIVDRSLAVFAQKDG